MAWVRCHAIVLFGVLTSLELRVFPLLMISSMGISFFAVLTILGLSPVSKSPCSGMVVSPSLCMFMHSSRMCC